MVTTEEEEGWLHTPWRRRTRRSLDRICREHFVSGASQLLHDVYLSVQRETDVTFGLFYGYNSHLDTKIINYSAFKCHNL